MQKSKAQAHQDGEIALKELPWHWTSLHPSAARGAGSVEGHLTSLLVFHLEVCSAQVITKANPTERHLEM